LGLKALAWQRLGVEMTHIEELIGKGKTRRPWTMWQLKMRLLMPLQTLKYH